MRRVVEPLVALSVAIVPLMAGALALQVSNPAGNPEALSKHAVLVARTTACQSPEKTEITASAEGLVNGVRRSIPLKVVTLSTPGDFAVTREWPSEGSWAIKLVARNPEYKNYATGALAAVAGNAVEWDSIHRYFHEPTDKELAAVLDKPAGPDGTSLK